MEIIHIIDKKQTIHMGIIRIFTDRKNIFLITIFIYSAYLTDECFGLS